MEPGGGLLCDFLEKLCTELRAAGTEQLYKAKAFRKWGWPQATKKRGIISDSSLGAVDGT